ncbi:hypothetical protein ACLQ2N_08160 [Streptomyces sp. DT224]|uniref:hypothetical protein n=1 Tax=Streptomyces sp. DT224 TaxID=3393426 RepID=UPI003CF49C94
MATIGYAQLPVPAGGDSPTVPADIAELAAAIDPHLVQTPVDLADRNNKLADAPAQTLAIARDGTTWLKTSGTANTWITMWEPLPAWRPFTPASGMTTGDITLGVRREGMRVRLKGRVAKSDGTNLVADYAVNLGAVPSDCIPVGLRSWPASCSLNGATIQATGRLEVIGLNTSSAYGQAGDVIWWFQDPPGTAWVDLSGGYDLD